MMGSVGAEEQVLPPFPGPSGRAFLGWAPKAVRGQDLGGENLVHLVWSQLCVFPNVCGQGYPHDYWLYVGSKATHLLTGICLFMKLLLCAVNAVSLGNQEKYPANFRTVP